MLMRFLSDTTPKVVQILDRYKPVSVSTFAFIKPTQKDRESLKALLTLTSRDTNAPFTVRSYYENGDLFGVPRGFYRQHKPENIWQKEDTTFHGVLRIEQEKLYRDIIANAEVSNGGIVKATTGIGKTVVALAIASYFKLPTLVIVPTVIIANQWNKAIQEFLKQEAGLIRQNTCNVKTISVALIHSLAKKGDYGLRDRFGLVIFDEIHKVSAETFSRTAGMFNCLYRLGLSATPRRKDGMENVFLWNIGQIVAQHISREIKPRIYMINYHNAKTNQIGCIVSGELKLGRYINRVAGVVERNKLIAKYIAKAYEQGREILVLSDRVLQLEILRTYLLAKGIPDMDIGFVTSQKKQPSRRILLATYGCAGIGFDKPSLDTLIFATPHSDVEQAVGRLLRRASKKRQPVVIDIVDTASPIMVKWSGRRYKQYVSMGGEVHNVRV